ncbi:MAG TPA: formyltransferase family protein, partial [Dongiaceae bacterium]
MPEPRAPLPVAVLISGRGSNLQALTDSFGTPGSPVKIVLVLSNRPEAPGLERAAKAGLKTEIVDHNAFATREDFDVALDREIRAAGAEFVALAGFMRLLTPQFVTAWKDRMVN